MSKNLVREIGRVALITSALGVIQLLVTIPLGYFGMPAVLGTLLGCFLSVMNFALMGIMLEGSITKKGMAGGLMGMGYVFRLAIIAVAIVWAIKVPYLNYVCAVIPLIYPRIVIGIISVIDKRKKRNEDKDYGEKEGETEENEGT